VFLDREATVEKACEWIARAAAAGAQLIVLPETFVPAYPAWVWCCAHAAPGGGAAVRRAGRPVGGGSRPETERLGRAARESGAWVAIGVNERDGERSRTSLYNTLLVFDPGGRLVSRHRKLMPTGGERLVWTPSERADLVVTTRRSGAYPG